MTFLPRPNRFAASPRPDSRRLFILASLAFIGILLYANTLHHPPIWDDHEFVVGQPFLRDGDNLWKILNPRWLFSVLPVRNCARPVWLASVLLDVKLAGGTMLGHRLSSLFWYLLGAFLVVLLASRLGGSETAAAMAGALFLVHPVHTEAVNIITFRAELLSFDFAALSTLFYLQARARAGRKRGAWIAASMLAFALALLSMEMAAGLPLVLLAADALFPESATGRPATTRCRDRLLVYAGYGVVLILYLLFRTPRSGYAMRGYSDAFSAGRDAFHRIVAHWYGRKFFSPPPQMELPPWSGPYYASAWVRFLTMSKIFGSYLRTVVWPYPLQGDYAPVPVVSPLDPSVWSSWAAWAALGAFAWVNRRRRPLAALGLLSIFLCLLPVSGVFALKNLRADRYLYFSSGGLCMAAGAILGEWAGDVRRGRRIAAVAAFSALFILGAGLTVRRNRDYRDDFSFYRATEAVDDRVPRVHFNLAQDFIYQNRPADAEIEFRKGLDLWPDSVRGRLLFADFLAAQGRLREASAETEKARLAATDENVQ